MADVIRDENRVPGLVGTLDSDGVTPTPVKANSTTHALAVSDGSTGSDLGPVNAPRDGNRVTGLLAVSSVDGITPVVIYANSNGELLVQST